jgi:hypothetical protein
MARPFQISIFQKHSNDIKNVWFKQDLPFELSC